MAEFKIDRRNLQENGDDDADYEVEMNYEEEDSSRHSEAGNKNDYYNNTNNNEDLQGSDNDNNNSGFSSASASANATNENTSCDKDDGRNGKKRKETEEKKETGGGKKKTKVKRPVAPFIVSKPVREHHKVNEERLNANEIKLEDMVKPKSWVWTKGYFKRLPTRYCIKGDQQHLAGCVQCHLEAKTNNNIKWEVLFDSSTGKLATHVEKCHPAVYKLHLKEIAAELLKNGKGKNMNDYYIIKGDDHMYRFLKFATEECKPISICEKESFIRKFCLVCFCIRFFIL